nr:uncharacterized protein LOC124814748 [Hydra vulgaris]
MLYLANIDRRVPYGFCLGLRERDFEGMFKNIPAWCNLTVDNICILIRVKVTSTTRMYLINISNDSSYRNEILCKEVFKEVVLTTLEKPPIPEITVKAFDT